eukprot:5158548-Alexandrium_andersonii.AAC.1
MAGVAASYYDAQRAVPPRRLLLADAGIAGGPADGVAGQRGGARLGGGRVPEPRRGSGSADVGRQVASGLRTTSSSGP